MGKVLDLLRKLPVWPEPVCPQCCSIVSEPGTFCDAECQARYEWLKERKWKETP